MSLSERWLRGCIEYSPTMELQISKSLCLKSPSFDPSENFENSVSYRAGIPFGKLSERLESTSVV